MTPSVIPPEPARLRIGDREIPVPPHPMSRDSRKRRHIEFVVTGPDLCVLDPLPASLWGMSALASVLCAGTGSVGFFAVTILKDGGWGGNHLWRRPLGRQCRTARRTLPRNQRHFPWQGPPPILLRSRRWDTANRLPSWSRQGISR